MDRTRGAFGKSDVVHVVLFLFHKPGGGKIGGNGLPHIETVHAHIHAGTFRYRSVVVEDRRAYRWRWPSLRPCGHDTSGNHNGRYGDVYQSQGPKERMAQGTAVYQPLVIEIDEYLHHALAPLLIHSERSAIPVTGCAQFTPLNPVSPLFTTFALQKE